MRTKTFGQSMGHDDAVKAAGLRKRFNRAHREFFPGKLVTMSGRTGEYNGVTVPPGSDTVHIGLYRSDEDVEDAQEIDLDPSFKVSVGLSDRPKVKRPIVLGRRSIGYDYDDEY